MPGYHNRGRYVPRLYVHDALRCPCQNVKTTSFMKRPVSIAKMEIMMKKTVSSIGMNHIHLMRVMCSWKINARSFSYYRTFAIWNTNWSDAFFACSNIYTAKTTPMMHIGICHVVFTWDAIESVEQQDVSPALYFSLFCFDDSSKTRWWSARSTWLFFFFVFCLFLFPTCLPGHPPLLSRHSQYKRQCFCCCFFREHPESESTQRKL